MRQRGAGAQAQKSPRVAGMEDGMSRVFYPRVLGAKVLYNHLFELSLYVELPSDEDSLWAPIGQAPYIGYMRLERIGVMRAGLSTYKVVELLPAGDPPRPLATFQSAFRVLSTEDYESLLQGRDVLPVESERR